MSTHSTPATTPSGGVNTSVFWERLWRTSGFQFVAWSLVAYFIYANGDRTRMFISASVSGLAVLYLMWFAASLRVTMADAGQDGWGAAATAASAAVGGLLLLIMAATVAGLTDLAWACFVLSSFVRAMLTMAPTFGFWRAGLISNSLFAFGVAVVVLTALGGTTWLSGGPWAPDGIYSRVLVPIIGLVWVVVLNFVAWNRPAARSGW
jgi:hypothetical protein